MTHEELMALPDVTHQLGEQVQYLDGKRTVFPFEQPMMGALFQKEDDGTFTDAEGNQWMTGWHQGVRVRRLFR